MIDVQIDMDLVQEKAQQAALEGALKEVRKYYAGHDSPYRKKIKEELEKQKVSWALKLPNIMQLISESLTVEIERIANTAIASSFVPIATKALTSREKEMKFSEVLKVFLGCYAHCIDFDYQPKCEIKESEQFGWTNVKISAIDVGGKELEVRLTLHRGKSESQYELLALPYTYAMPEQQKMKLINEGAILEMPFTKAMLKDDFYAFIANCVIAGTQFVIDQEYFSDHMIEEYSHQCHC
ncbi:MAG: hypothetical protein AAF738_03940 [Bacteroidota bacterium]